MILRKLIFKLIGHPEKASAKAYEQWLRNKGVTIGNHLTIRNFGWGGKY